MSELSNRIQQFFETIEFIEIKTKWFQHLITLGIDRDEAAISVAEIGHVIAEYRRTLTRLAHVIDMEDPKSIPESIHDWAVGTLVGIPEIEEPMRYLEKYLEKYSNSPVDDEDSANVTPPIG